MKYLSQFHLWGNTRDILSYQYRKEISFTIPIFKLKQ